MRARPGLLVLVLVAVALASAGALVGHELGAPDGPLVAQTGGTSSSSGSGSSGSSGDGSSGSSGEGSSGSSGDNASGDGSSGSGQGGEGSSGSGQAGDDDGSSGSGRGGTGGAPDDGSSGLSGSGNGGDGADDGTSGLSGSGNGGGDGSGGGEGGGDGGGGGGGGTTVPGGGGGTGTTVPGGTATSAPAAIPQPGTPSSIPSDRVGEGRPVTCGPAFLVGLRCFDVGDVDGLEGVRVPDGLGGFIIVPIAPVPVVNVDTGASVSASSNVDLRIGVNERTGEVVRVERRAPARSQRGLATIAVLLLAVIAAASVATYLRVRRMGSP